MFAEVTLQSQGVVLHLVSEVRFRWVGWSISAGVLVLALTFMSNQQLVTKEGVLGHNIIVPLTLYFPQHIVPLTL